MSLLERAAGFLVVHPDWWGGPPAILKGWIDRVLRPGSAYEVPEGYGRRESEGMLQGRKALVIVPGDSEESGILEEFWIKRVWGFCGVDARLIYLPNYSKSGRIEKQKNLIIAGEAVKETFL
jgi:FMN-dependent NADH-azoreductase